VGHSLNPVRLLFTGRNLSNAAMRSHPGLAISNVTASATGNYLFCDLYIDPSTPAGKRNLAVATPEGSASVEFELLSPLPRTGSFSGFSPDDAIYLIMPDRFANGDPANDDPSASPGLLNRRKPRDYHGGDLQGVIERLPYLKELGVTAIWLTPWYDNANRFNTRETYTHDNQRTTNGIPSTDYHGYGAVDFYGVEERLGDMAKLQEFIAVAHQAGFKVIQDQVANHTGPYHPWVKNPPTPTWYNGTEADHLDNSWQTWTLAAPNPPADLLKSTLEGWFINILPDLNQNDPEVATYLIQNSLWWIGMTGVDAVRQDTLPYVPRQYWAAWTKAVQREYPTVTILGEVFDGKPGLVSFFQGGRTQFDGVDTGVDTLFDFPLYYALRDVFVRNLPMTRLAQALAADTNYVDPSVLVTFLGLHDVGRFMGESGATPAGLQLAFAFLATVRGTPMIYYGDEIGLSGGGDPNNRRDFPGGWPEDSRNAFESRGRTPVEEQIHARLAKLLQVRQELEPLRRGKMQILQADAETFAMSRTTDAESVLIAFNNNRSEARQLTIALPVNAREAIRWYDKLGILNAVDAIEGKLNIELPAAAAVILVPDAGVAKADRAGI